MGSFTSPLLQLPYALRRRIYIEAGVVQNLCIDLGTYPNGTRKNRKDGSLIDLVPTLNLLHTCNTVHDEVLEMLYSHNKFFLHYCRSGLQPLLRLPPRILATMSHLEISLRLFRIGRYPRYHMKCDQRCSPSARPNSCESHDKPLDRGDVQILSDWNMAAEHLFANITPYTMKLGLVCDTDVGQPDVAERLLEPFTLAPPLVACNIRLAPHHYEPFTTLVRSVATKASRKRETSIRPLHLPDEILLNILRYTDLVTSIRAIEVSERKGSSGLRQRRYHQYTEDTSHHPFLGRLLDENSDCLNCRNEQILCYCWRHSAWTRDCVCWYPPTALFLIDKRWLRLAQEVLIRENRVIIEPMEWSNRSQDLDSCPLVPLLQKSRSMSLAMHWLKEIEGTSLHAI